MGLYEKLQVCRSVEPYHYTRESIDWQDPDKYKDLEDVISSIRDTYSSNPSIADNEDAVMDMEASVSRELQKAFGGGFAVRFRDGSPMHIRPSRTISPSVLDRDWINDALKSRKGTQNAAKKILATGGYIDTKNALLGGSFTKRSGTIGWDPWGEIKSDLTAKETTAGVIHEVGHAFTLFLSMGNMYRTNRVLADALLEYSSKSQYGKVKRVLMDTLSKKNMLTDRELNAIEDKKEGVVFSYAVLGRLNLRIRSNMLGGQYSSTAGEQLADNFATRCGYGTALISGLSRENFGYVKGHSKQSKGKWIRGLHEETLGSPTLLRPTQMKLAYFNGMVQGGLIHPALAELNAAAAVSAVLNVHDGRLPTDTQENRESAGYDYDSLLYRTKRVRDQLVSKLKNSKLSPKVVKQAIHDIGAIESIMKDTLPLSHHWDYVPGLVDHKRARKFAERDLERALETLVNNPLYVTAAKAGLK